MNNHSCRFVDNRQIFVLVNHLQRDVLGSSFQWRTLRLAKHLDQFVAMQLQRRLSNRAIYLNLLLLDQFLHARAADVHKR